MRHRRPLLRSALAAATLAACASPAPEFVRMGERIELSAGGEPVATLHLALPRPYVHPLLAPGGLPVTRGFPIDPAPDDSTDHPHHTSLWFAHGAVGGADFWSSPGGDARQVLSDEPVFATDPREVSVEFGLDWIAGGRTLARERRRLTLRARGSVRELDLRSSIEPVVAPLLFGDTKEGTFALRLAPTLRMDGPHGTGHMTSSEGARDGAAWGTRARWMAAHGEVEGRPVVVAILDHPSNPRHPTWWHARTYGLLAANPFGTHDFEKAPAGTGDLVLAAGERLEFRYRVVLASAPFDAAAIESAWARFARD